ncbi:hypothetical protein [Fusobacterium sp.]|uniref:hypothetical protein n=1 Tax=Fusobacterium sp. TaxID=68766 RepID=UPI002A82FCF5|nr:hypothetical protein [Fusobacterium sp.]
MDEKSNEKIPKHLYESEEFYENDRERKKISYLERRLNEIDFNLNLFDRKIKAKIKEFFLIYADSKYPKKKKDSKGNEQTNKFLNNLIKNRSIDEINKILDKIGNKKMQKELSIYENEFFIKYHYDFRILEMELEKRQSSSYEGKTINEEILNYLEVEKELLKKYLFFMEREKTFLNEVVDNSNIESGMIINFEYALFNLYFAKRIEKNKRKNIYNIINSEIQKYLNEQKIEDEISIKNINYKYIIYSFFLFLQILYMNENKYIIIDNFPQISTEKINEISENLKDTIFEEYQEDYDNIKLKEINPDRKKDNLHKDKMEKLKKLMKILDDKNDGLILPKMKEIMKVLYYVMFLSNGKYEETNLYTYLNRILKAIEENKLDNVKDELDFINFFLKKIIFQIHDKEEEYYYIIEIMKNFFKIIKNINKKIDIREIKKELIKLINFRLEIINKLAIEIKK